MQTINISANPGQGIAQVDRLIRAAGGLNPTVSATLAPDQLVRTLVQQAPSVRRSELQPNGIFELDLGAIRLVWVVCYDQLGSCAIFFLSHFDREGLGAHVMANFIDELNAVGSHAGFEVGALSGPMYEAEPEICRILANGKVAA
ncbi:hypothetical protein [Nocardia asiatica]|uniref:hypothetical protein n=1 Tax=Nocardia asiatica TaxID=209252 RepID=UPI002456F20D|nr:hypothetical protein [Nocardia asiatica]